MTALNPAIGAMALQPPHVPLYSSAIRVGFALLMAVLAALAYYFDFPFSSTGVFQPMMLALGVVLISYVIDIPFRALLPRLGMILLFVIAALSAWLAWYYRNDVPFLEGFALASNSLLAHPADPTKLTAQDGADSVWKLASLFIVFFTIAAGVWNAPFKNFHSKIGSIPMMFIVLFAFIGCSLWTIFYSTADAKIYPVYTYVGLKQYVRLFAADVWTTSWHNGLIYLVIVTAAQFIIGFLIAVFMDQKIRAEGVFRTIYLYPIALSLIVTGHVWAWILSPEYGLEKSVRQLGWTSFSFDWIANIKYSIYAVTIAGVWQGTGLVMALMIAGLRSIDDDVWKAARVDGVPKWRTYIQIVLPMMRPVLITTFVIVASGCVRLYDLVVALTDGGPGTSSNVPAQYVYKYLFSGSISQGLAAATLMLLASAIILIPWVYVEFVKNKQVR